MENIDLNELVEELYRKNDHEKHRIISLEAETIYFIDKRALEVKIKISSQSDMSCDDILKQAERIKEWRDGI
jgi:hypothetical protein